MFPYKEESMAPMQQIQVSRKSFRNGLALNRRSSHSEALTEFRRAVQLQEVVFGKYHKETIRSYLEQGKAALRLVKQDPKMNLLALQSFQRATRMAHVSFAKGPRLDLWNEIEACWYEVHPETDLSLDVLRKIFESEELGDKAVKKGQYVKAIEHYCEALSQQDALLGSDSIDGADIRFKLGSALQETSATPQAQRTLAQAYQCFVDQVGEDHPATMGCVSKMNAISAQ